MQSTEQPRLIDQTETQINHNILSD